jgi:hypothetical protein
VPIGDQRHRSKNRSYFDYLVGDLLEKRWHLEAQGLGGLQIDHQLELGRALYRQLAWFSALEDAVDVL